MSEHVIKSKKSVSEQIGSEDTEKITALNVTQYAEPYALTEDTDLVYKIWVENLIPSPSTSFGFTEDDILDTVGDANWYIEYKQGGVAITKRPYSINVREGTHDYGIPAIVENDDAWPFPRIYNMRDPSNAQTITIYAQ